jgi:hypothetical protein
MSANMPWELLDPMTTDASQPATKPISTHAMIPIIICLLLLLLCINGIKAQQATGFDKTLVRVK